MDFFQPEEAGPSLVAAGCSLSLRFATPLGLAVIPVDGDTAHVEQLRLPQLVRSLPMSPK